MSDRPKEPMYGVDMTSVFFGQDPLRFEIGHHGTDLLWYRPNMVQNHYGTLVIARLLRVNFVIGK